MNHSTGKPNKREQARIDALRELGCSACASLFVVNINYLELHHILQGNTRMGHWYTIFLCRGHHQGDWSAAQREIFEPRELVAISDGRKRFSGVYCGERYLWEIAQDRLKLPKDWPTSKIVPRPQLIIIHGGKSC